ncbi:Serine/threonine-protein kinase Nek2 [Colletotrichum sp. SAR 10_66]|nr:Serine/threonine-protein kinase Nek2 [Colletotrichum sp. SAR 10_75]KAJ4998135.1 Serine/threonine-protein kinase Nek2 [Colletotrichum sp. SAR 10_66]
MNDFHPEWIWGDDAETTVFAQGYGNDRTIIFSFSLDASKPSTSLANRICACMHGIEVDDESKSFKDSAAMREALWNAVRDVWSNNLLRNMPKHPNVLPAPSKLVTYGNQDGVVCGTLQPFYEGGDVGSRIEKSNILRARIPLTTKVRWCTDMAAAVAHTHRQAKTYHMDIKPGNFLIDQDGNLVLGDWEQTDAPTTTIAPEADGTWDVEMEEEGGGLAGNGWNRPRLQYTKYEGPPRRNTEEDVLGDYPWNTWNVFPGWSAEHPLALELAEVFSLGRAMWMLLRQPDMDFDEIEHPSQLKTSWEGAEDIPTAWVGTEMIIVDI